MVYPHIRDYDVIIIGESYIEFQCNGDIALSDTFKKDIGGSDIYVAISAAKQGSAVSLITAIARDPFYSLIRERLLSQGINIDNVTSCEGYNGIYFLSTRKPDEREYLYHRTGSAGLTISPSMVYESLIKNTKIVYASSELQSLSKSARHAIFKAFNTAHTNNVMVAYDPNLRLHRWSLDDAKESLWSVLPLLDVIFPSAPEESKALFGYERPLDVIGFLWDRGVSIVAVKNGKDGCLVGYDGKIEEFTVPDLPSPVKYLGLIGSVFNGAFLHSIARGNDPFVAAKFALSISSYKGMKGNGIDSLPLEEDVE